jgi:catechol 2,3-dioxygenase-like lactoylglutathione lyase family enzyme
MSSLAGVHHIQLAAPAGAEDRMREFYGGTLGMTEKPKPPALWSLRSRHSSAQSAADRARDASAIQHGVWFTAPGIEIHIGVDEDFRPARKAHPGLLVDDLDGMAERLRAAGHQVRPDDLLPGFRRFYVDDPVGNRIELLEPL